MLNSRYLSLYKIEKNLGFLEEKIVFLVNEKGSKPREILEKVSKTTNKKYAYTTVMTVMDKLYKKGFFERKKIGKTYYYFPVLPVKKLKEGSFFYLVESLVSFLSPLKIVSYLFYFVFVFPMINFFSKSFLSATIKTIFVLFLCFLMANGLLVFYFNGIFDYLFLLIKEPKIFFNYFSVHLVFLWECFSWLGIFLIFIFGVYLLRKVFKNSYQLKIAYGK
ncbi:MAG: BlaI/MecI/CopY family transcriptional regulator [Patescibacteria group bacterium]|nr:BlaI/MecI/CopY family transcriptional regulator [Patescibacteria group bacterium]